MAKPPEKKNTALKGQAPSSSLHVARGIATVLDTWRLDPIIGLLPGVGDVACGLVGLVIVGIAALHKAPKVTIARMLLNIAFDTLLGSIPLVGDVLDFWFPAHTLNVRLLERAQTTGRSHPMDYVWLGLAGLFCMAALALPLVALWWVIAHLAAGGGAPGAPAAR